MIKNVRLMQTILVCDKCGYEWQQRSKQPPRMCPKCKSYGWNKLTEEEEKKSDQ